MPLSGRPALFVVLVPAFLLAARPVEARRVARGEGVPDTIRVPFQTGKVYRVQLRPGDPLLVELPGEDSAAQLWFDPKWWMAETEPDSPAVTITASHAAEVVGRRGFIHILTAKRRYRISIEVEGVEENQPVPAVLELYDELGTSAGAKAVAQETRLKADRELVYAQKLAAEKARAEVSAFRRRSLMRLRTDFDWRGDFRIARIADDGVFTWILLQDKSVDRPIVQFIDQTGKAEAVNCDLDPDPPQAGLPPGMYVVQKVLRPGEKFKLLLGKQATWISLRGSR
jgi:hypothetical protein